MKENENKISKRTDRDPVGTKVSKQVVLLLISSKPRIKHVKMAAIMQEEVHSAIQFLSIKGLNLTDILQ